MLQPFDVNSEDRGKHKFMVQTCFAPDEGVSIDNVWKSIQPNELMDSKLRVVFELPPELVTVIS